MKTGLYLGGTPIGKIVAASAGGGWTRSTIKER